VRIDDVSYRTLPAARRAGSSIGRHPQGRPLAFSYAVAPSSRSGPASSSRQGPARRPRAHRVPERADPLGKPATACAERGRRPLEVRGARGAADLRDARLRGERRPAPSLLGRAGAHRADRQAPLAIVYLVDTLRADHTSTTATRARRPRAHALSPRTPCCSRPPSRSALDQAERGLDPDLAPAGRHLAVSCATRSTRDTSRSPRCCRRRASPRERRSRTR